MRTPKRVLLAALAVSLALLLGACGDDGSGLDQVASLGGEADGNDTDEAKELTEEERQQAHLDFAACMREHGINMPDPEFSGDGGVMTRQQTAEQEGEPNFDAIDEAHKACEHILADVINERRAQMDPEEAERMKQQALDFAKCMREHGVDMPDPQFDGGRITQRMEVDGTDGNFEEAQEACAPEGGPMRAGPGMRGGGAQDGDE